MDHRVGYIGFGGMASGYHYDIAHDRKDVAPNLEPAAVYELRESRRQVAEERGLTAYDDLDKFLASDDFDIVVVATSNNFHKEMTIRSLRAGKHVICEKPAAMNAAELEEMIAVSKETGKYLFIHQNRRFDIDFLTVKHAYETGRLGKLKSIESNFSGGTLHGWRAFRDHGGGILFDWGVHLIDQIVYLVQEPVKSVRAAVRCEKNPEVDDRTTVIITFESGLRATVKVAGTFLVPKPRFAVYGDRGILWMDEIYNGVGTLREAKSAEWVEEDALVYGKDGVSVRPQELLEEDLERITYPDDGFKVDQDWGALYKNMLETIDGKAEMLVKHEEALTVMRIIDAAMKSSETGELVTF
ncbi:MAG: Gfo/Idh/MocA family oxidoreductase [Clostridia bacterium]|nr:Gfo/Idh/MocA family oxidoreductase [Clostridia bacterium]